MLKEILIAIFMLGGLFFLTVGTVGMLRFPDIYTRAHGAAKCDTLGAILCLISLIIYSGVNFDSLKIILAIIFLWMTAPTATHLIARAAFKREQS